ncbi:hypothetical protein N9L68_09300, partial [bacterium]|nr:hypothetical protein [bacterium]
RALSFLDFSALGQQCRPRVRMLAVLRATLCVLQMTPEMDLRIQRRRSQRIVELTKRDSHRPRAIGWRRASGESPQ